VNTRAGAVQIFKEAAGLTGAGPRAGKAGRCDGEARAAGAGKLFNLAFGLGDECSASVNGDDEAPLTQDFHSAPDGLVAASVVLGQRAFGQKPRAWPQFAGGDPGGDVVGDLGIREVGITAAARFKIAHSTT